MTTRTLKRLIALALLVWGGSFAMAGQCGYEHCWGAIGFGQEGQVSWSYGKWSEEEAYNALQDECDWTCTEVRTFFNSCGAMARGENRRWAWSPGQTRRTAARDALGFCSSNSQNCKVIVWACSY